MATFRRAAAPLLSQQICQSCLRSSTTARTTFARTLARPQRAQTRTIQPSLTSIRWHSAPANPSKQYDFAQIKQLTEQPSSERILIGASCLTLQPLPFLSQVTLTTTPDVREPSEYSAGYIPTALNIPVKSSPDALFLPDEEFEDRFGFEKPGTDKEVVFYCRSGVRSSAAAQLAQQQGYTNVSEYRGSWLDWEKQGGEAMKP